MTATTQGSAFAGGPPGLPELSLDRDAIIGTALLIRAVEERFLELFSAGELAGTVHTCVGQEFSAATIGAHLREGDQVFSNHRCHGHYLAATGDVLGLVAEVMGRSAGVCAGRGGSQHLCRPGFLSTGILGGALPIAAGTALAAKLCDRSDITVVFIGDGTLGEGVLYEVLNLASLWRLPMLFVLEDNGYAQSTARRETLAGDAIARAKAFGIRTSQGDTWDWESLWHRLDAAVREIRRGAGPCFFQVATYRLGAHSKGDDQRDQAELAEFRRRDPLGRILAEGGQPMDELAQRVRRTVDDAVTVARSSPPAVPDHPAPSAAPVRWQPAGNLEGRFVDLLHNALADGMRANPRMTVLGEDVRAPYGGAFKVTRDLSSQYHRRVLNTPISEAAIVGVGTGLALCGMPSFVEIMFGDFLTLATDQLVNQASKIAFLRGPDAPAVDLVVRAPMGGRRGYGPTHSQTLDRMFIGTPGLRVIAANSLVDPAEIVATLCAGGCGPTVLVENKLLYGRRIGASVPAGFAVEHSDGQFPMARVHAGNRVDVTLIGYGGMCDYLLTACDELFAKHDLLAQVLCPVQIYPLDWTPFADLATAGRAVVVAEEGQGFAGFGAELIAQLAETTTTSLVPLQRVMPEESPIPAAPELEENVLPGVDDIVRAAVTAVNRL
jgi:2-oxoisovalerate dehydrogenase E1 component